MLPLPLSSLLGLNFFVFPIKAYTLLLGLGYLDDYKRKDAFTCVELKESAKQIDDRDHEGLKLQTLLTIIATVRIAILKIKHFVWDLVPTLSWLVCLLLSIHLVSKLLHSFTVRGVMCMCIASRSIAQE